MQLDRYMKGVQKSIAAHPLALVGAAFALGALVGMGTRRPGRAAAPRIGSAAIAGLAAFAIQAAKDFAVREATEAAMRWWERRRQGASASESEASEESNVEAFLEH